MRNISTYGPFAGKLSELKDSAIKDISDILKSISHSCLVEGVILPGHVVVLDDAIPVTVVNAAEMSVGITGIRRDEKTGNIYILADTGNLEEVDHIMTDWDEYPIESLTTVNDLVEIHDSLYYVFVSLRENHFVPFWDDTAEGIVMPSIGKLLYIQKGRCVHDWGDDNWMLYYRDKISELVEKHYRKNLAYEDLSSTPMEKN